MATVLKNVKKDSRFLSLTEAAEMRSVTMQTVRRWIDLGILEAYEFGGRIVCKKTSVETVQQRLRPRGKPGHKTARTKAKGVA